jgi:hypothetical protein
MTNKNRTIIIAVSLAVVAAAASLGVFLLWKPEPKGIVVAVSNLPDSLNPVLAQNISGLNADELVFDGLVNFEVDPEAESHRSWPGGAIEQDPATRRTIWSLPAGSCTRHGVDRGRRQHLRRLYRRAKRFPCAISAVLHPSVKPGCAHGE